MKRKIIIISVLLFISFFSTIKSVHAEKRYVHWDSSIGNGESLRSYLEEKIDFRYEYLIKEVKTIEFVDTSKESVYISRQIRSVDISEGKDGSVIASVGEDAPYNYVLYIKYYGTLLFNENSSNLFNGFNNVEFINGLEYVDTSNVTNMSGMFRGLPKIKELDLISFDTSNVTDMSYMFSGMHSLTSLNTNNFDTSNVTDMSYMFSGMHSLTSLNTNNFDTSKVTRMSHMFYDVTELTTLDLSNFDTSKVTDMSGMFDHMRKLTTLDLSNFDTSKVTNMSAMFHQMHSLTSLNTNNFDTSNVTNMSHMFYDVTELTTLDLSNFDTSNVTDMYYMFTGMHSLTSLDLSNFDTSKVTNMSGMFSGMSELTSLDLSNFDTSNVTNMSYMFSGMSELTTLDLSNFDTSNVTDMAVLFGGMSKLTTLDLSNFDTSKVTNMSGMFNWKSELTSLDLSNFDTSKVTNMSGMFSGMSGLTTLDLSNFDTSNVTDMSYMFSGMSGLTTLDLNNFDTSKITNMSRMFSGMSELTTLDLSNFDTSNVTNMSGMFSGMSGLTTLDLNNFDTSNVTDMSYMFSEMSELTILDLSRFNTKRVINMLGMFSKMNKLTILDISGFTIRSSPNYSELITCTSLKKIITPSYNGIIYLPTTLYDNNFNEYTYEYNNTKSGTILAKKYTIYFDNDITSRSILYGTKYGELPKVEKEDYVFVGWYDSPNYKNKITNDSIFLEDEDIHLYAKLANSKYNVTFVDEDDSVLKEKREYNYGTSANDIEKPNNPSKPSTIDYVYIFAGWTPKLEDVTEDIIYKATYNIASNKNTITWKNYDGSVLETDENVEYGTTPSYDGVTPTREKDAQYTYTYAGWDKEVTSVTGDVTYTATFKPTPNGVPVYRLYNPINGEHLYTKDAYEVIVIYETQGWGFEGIGWYTSNTGTPVYRLYQPQLGNHLYTSDTYEIFVITNFQGWVMDFDGAPVMYSNGDVPIYRLFNPGLQGQHHLTTDLNEYNVIPAWGWQQEGISMNALSKGVPITTYYYSQSGKPIDFDNIATNVLN